MVRSRRVRTSLHRANAQSPLSTNKPRLASAKVLISRGSSRQHHAADGTAPGIIPCTRGIFRIFCRVRGEPSPVPGATRPGCRMPIGVKDRVGYGKGNPNHAGRRSWPPGLERCNSLRSLAPYAFYHRGWARRIVPVFTQISPHGKRQDVAMPRQDPGISCPSSQPLMSASGPCRCPA